MARFDFDKQPAEELRRRHFTVEQANRAVVLVKRIVADVVKHYARLMDLQESIDSAQAGGEYDRGESTQQELVAVAQKLQAFSQELDGVGVELKDWSVGVVDFPCIVDGREAYFCWKYGEENVEYWHELDEGSTGRLPVAELLAGQTHP